VARSLHGYLLFLYFYRRPAWNPSDLRLKMVRANIRARWVRRDDHMARRIVLGLRKPVKRFRLVNLAKQWNWDEMFNRIDNGEAGVNDFMDYAVCRAWAAAPPPAPHLQSALPSMPSISSVSDVVPRWGVVVPQMRWTCLCWAVASPVDMSIGVIDELVRRGATVSGVVDVYGRTPLHIAVESGHIDSVKRLVHHGADICSLDTVCRPLARRAQQRCCALAWRIQRALPLAVCTAH